MRSLSYTMENRKSPALAAKTPGLRGCCTFEGGLEIAAAVGFPVRRGCKSRAAAGGAATPGPARLHRRQIDEVGIQTRPHLSGFGVIHPADTAREIVGRRGVHAKDFGHAVEGISRDGNQIGTMKVL